MGEEGQETPEGINIPENKLLKESMESVLKSDPSLKVLEELARGETSTVYDSKKDGEDCVLKISRIYEGMISEVKAFKDLQGIRGIPRLINSYQEGERAIALLAEKIKGDNLEDYLDENLEAVVEAFTKLRSMIRQIHKRGYLLPEDWRKKSNLLIDQNNQPHMVDLGESQILSKDREQAEMEINRDFRIFHDLIYPYLDRVTKKDKNKLQDIILAD